MHKLSAGDGYTYLTRHISGGDVTRARGQDAADYYTAEGNPPGRWLGQGITALGIEAGEPVTEEQMKALYGEGMHPNAAAIIAAYQEANIRAEMTPGQLDEVTTAAADAARLGAPFPQFTLLEPFADRVRDRLAVIEQQTGRTPTAAEVARVRAQESRRQRHAVAGYDLVFTPPKSVSLLWALHPGPAVRAAVRQAHNDAIGSAMQLLEEHAAFTRTGKAGVAQIDTHGLVAVAFDHYDSRAGDPNLHTHLVLSNKVQGSDGKWRALDARALHAMTVAASEHYNTAITATLVERLGARFAPRLAGPSRQGKQPVWEIDGIPASWLTGFSRRRAAIVPRYEELVAGYRRDHGHDPSPATAHQLARQATLETRQGKKQPQSLAAKREAWTQELLTQYGPAALEQLRHLVPGVPATGGPPAQHPAGRNTGTESSQPVVPVEAVARSIDRLAAQVVDRVGEQRSTWTVWNLHAEAERLLRDPRVAASLTAGSARLTGSDVADLVARVVARAVSPEHSMSLAAPVLVAEPGRLRRRDRESVFEAHGSGRYTSRAVLDAEQRLLDAARTGGSDSAPRSLAAISAVLDGFEATTRYRLDAGQRHLVTVFATDPRRLVVGLGAAGTGKTTAMRAYRYALTHTRATNPAEQVPGLVRQPRLVPLATSAVSASVLAGELGVPAENLHKFLYEHLHGASAAQLDAGAPPGQLPASHHQFALRAGDVILVDEAGMAGTRNLDRLLTIAGRHGASVRLLGDYRQLAAVESGGALRLIASDIGAAELSTLHRFADADEAAATLQLRAGDAGGLDFYASRDRIAGGSTSAMLEAAYTGWLADMRAGKTTFMPAATNTDVTNLSARARLDRVAAGQVEAAGAALHDGNAAGAGDWIVTRANDRRLRTTGSQEWVHNGDPWQVVTRREDGALNVRHLRHGGQLTLPAGYVAANVELLYGSTVHRVQGGTVDTAHPLITEAMTREHLYVAATRARQRTTFYVATHDVLPLDDDERLDATRRDPGARHAREILQKIIAREGAERSATETIRDTQNTAASLATLIPRYLHADTAAHAPRHETNVRRTLGPGVAALAVNDPAWPVLVRALRRGEQTGWQTGQLLTAAAGRFPSPLEAVPAPANGLNSATARDRDVPGVAARLATAIEASIAELPVPARLVRPTTGEAARYAQLIAAVTGLGITGHGEPLSVQVALSPPAALTIRAADEHAPALPAESRNKPGPNDYAQALGLAAGSKLVGRALRESAWPALQHALRRAETAGHDPHQLLRIYASRRDLNRSFSASETLAWRIHRHIETRPPVDRPGQTTHSQTTQITPPEQGIADRPEAELVDDWRRLAWMLAAHEHTGGDAARLLTTCSTDENTPGSTPGRRVPLAVLTGHFARQLQHVSTGSPAPGPEDGQLPPWLPPPCDDPYLRSTGGAICDRMTRLADDLEKDRPAWASILGPAPTDPRPARAWRAAVSIAAAYREQRQITDDDPAHPLGPYIEPGQDGHHAYQYAAAAIAAGRRLAHHEQPAPPDTAVQVSTTKLDHREAQPAASPDTLIAHRVATGTYLALPEAERTAVAAGVIARLGDLWAGGEHSTVDSTATRAAHSAQLRASLAERGHLSASTGEPSAQVRWSADEAIRGRRPARSRSSRATSDMTPRRAPRTTLPTPPTATTPTRKPAPALLVRPQHIQDSPQLQPRL